MGKPAFNVGGPYPRLSDDLPLCDPRECAACGVGGELEAWQEHDTGDNPESLFVVLCPRCSTELIEAHPRLYRHLSPNEPAPGVMPICVDCPHRAGSKCWHPTSPLRGRGLRLGYPQPTTGFLDYAGRGGRRQGHAFTIHPGPVYSCSGKRS